MAKVQIKSEKLSRSGEIFSIMEQIDALLALAMIPHWDWDAHCMTTNTVVLLFCCFVVLLFC